MPELADAANHELGAFIASLRNGTAKECLEERHHLGSIVSANAAFTENLFDKCPSLGKAFLSRIDLDSLVLSHKNNVP